MSDPSAPVPPIDEISRRSQELLRESMSEADVQAYMAAKMPDFACVGCGHRDFDMFVNPRRPSTLSQVHQHVRDGGFIAAVAVVCTTCGMLYNIRWQNVRDWLTAAAGKDVARG